MSQNAPLRLKTIPPTERVFFFALDPPATPLGQTLTYGELASGWIYVQSDPIGLAGGSLSLYAYVNSDPLQRIDPDGLFDFAGNIKNFFHDRYTAGLGYHYIFGKGETIFIPESACPLFLSDPSIQKTMGSIYREIGYRGENANFARKTENYVNNIFAFGNGADNIYVACSNGDCTVRVNRVDAYTDPEDKFQSSRIGKSAFSPEANEHGTPFYFGLSCEVKYKRPCE